MSRINSLELATMRRLMATTLPDTCVIKRVSRTENGDGTYTDSWTPVAGGTVACRLDSRRTGRINQETAEGGRMDIVTSLMMTLPYDAPIQESDRVVHNGLEYIPTDMQSDTSQPLCLRVSVEKA